MIRLPRDDAKRGARGRARANMLARSGSRREENPAQPPELRDEKKETKAVESCMSKLQLDDDAPTTSRKKRYRESKKCNSQQEHCAVCLMDGHHRYLCPYLESVPLGVTEVGEGYIILCRSCGLVGNRCRHGRSYAHLNRYSVRLGVDDVDDPSPNVEQIRARQREMAEKSRARAERGEPPTSEDSSSESSSEMSS